MKNPLNQKPKGINEMENITYNTMFYKNILCLIFISTVTRFSTLYARVFFLSVLIFIIFYFVLPFCHFFFLVSIKCVYIFCMSTVFIATALRWHIRLMGLIHNEALTETSNKKKNLLQHFRYQKLSTTCVGSDFFIFSLVCCATCSLLVPWLQNKTEQKDKKPSKN